MNCYKTTPAWPKLKRHWVGACVETLTQQETQDGNIFPAGLFMRVTGYYQGLKLEYIEACPSCKLKHRHRITRVPVRQVRLIGFETSHEPVKGFVLADQS